MPTFKSDKGIWTPAKERSILPADEAKGRPEAQIYEGEDRAARAVLNEEKVTHLGMPVEQDPEVVCTIKSVAEKGLEPYSAALDLLNSQWSLGGLPFLDTKDQA